MKDFNSEEVILLHLESYEEFKEENEVPYNLTPRGIIRKIDISEKDAFDILDKLKEKGLVEEDKKEIIGMEKERNVFFLTEEGKKREQKFWDKIKDENVSISTGEEEKELTFKKVKNHIEGRNPIVKALNVIDDEGKIDLSNLNEKSEIFVGRENELNKLKESLKTVKNQGSKLCIIEGEAGIGKTSLVCKLKPFTQELGFKFLNGTCQSETSDPYLPFKEAFSEYIEGDEESQKETGMAFIGAEEKEMDLQERKLFDAKKKETFYETTKYVEEIANEDPLVVFLDDLQWVDKASLDILAYMIQKLENIPIFFIGTFRPEDVSKDHHLTEFMHRLKRSNGFEKISLVPLSIENTEEIIKSILGSENVPSSFIEIVHGKTEGNPLFIKETITQMQDEGLIDVDRNIYPEKGDEISVSEMVHNVIERRINRLDDETVKVIEIGSVIGDSIPFDLLSQTLDIDEIDLLDHIDILTANQLLDEDPSDEILYFSHDLIQSTVYQRIKRLKRKLLHKRVAENIEKIYGDEINEWFSDLGRHYERAGESKEAVDYYVKSGEKAEGMFASEDAAEMYEKAFDLLEGEEGMKEKKVELLENMTNVYFLLGRFDECREYLNEGLELVEDPKKKQGFYKKIAESHHHQGNWDTALDTIEKALSITDEENKERCELLGLKAGAYQKKGEYDRAHDITKKEKDLADKIDEEKYLGQVYHDLGTVLTRKGKLEEGKSYLEDAIELREKNDEKHELYKSLNNLAIVHKDLGNHKKSKEYFEKASDVVKQNNLISEMSGILNNVGYIYSEMGLIDDSIENYEESIKWGEKTDDRETKSLAIGNLGKVYLVKGELEKARENIEKAIEIMEELGYSYGLTVNLQYLGKLNKKNGDLKKAEDVYKESLEHSRKAGIRKREALGLNRIGEIKIIKGEYDEAEEFFDKALEIAEDIGAKDIEAIAKGRIGELQVKKREIDKAEKTFEQGLELARSANDEKSLMINKLGMGKIKLEKDQISLAEEAYKEVSELLEKWYYPDIHILNYLLKSGLLMKESAFEEAKKQAKEALEDSKKIKDKLFEIRCLIELSKINSQMEEKEDSKRRAEEALKIADEIGLAHIKEDINKIL